MARVESFEYHVTKFTRLQRLRLRIKTSSFTSFSIVSMLHHLGNLLQKTSSWTLILWLFFDKNLFEIVTRLENGGGSTKISWHEKTEDPGPVLRSLCSGLVENITLGAVKQLEHLVWRNMGAVIWVTYVTARVRTPVRTEKWQNLRSSLLITESHYEENSRRRTMWLRTQPAFSTNRRPVWGHVTNNGRWAILGNVKRIVRDYRCIDPWHLTTAINKRNTRQRGKKTIW